ncbi:hypothetical protein VTK56DRAFT_9940 [Thermocarpiscus australiensis]
MGTRHLICIFWKGQWVVAQYGQFDGYPEGQGVKIFHFLSVARNIENLKTGLEHHIYQPSQEQFDAIEAECEVWDRARMEDGSFYQLSRVRMDGVNQLYPSLARETSAGILGIIARASQTEAEGGTEGGEAKEPRKIPLKLDLEFANNGLFCEWTYVIDLDKEVLEVFGGSEAKREGHRFENVGRKEDAVPRFVCSFKFSELYLMKGEDEFLAKVKEALSNEAEEYEEDNVETNEEANSEVIA